MRKKESTEIDWRRQKGKKKTKFVFFNREGNIEILFLLPTLK